MYMQRLDNVINWEDQSNNYGNEEIQVDDAQNQQNPLDTNWTEKNKYGRDATVLWSGKGKCSKPSESCSHAVQRNT